MVEGGAREVACRTLRKNGHLRDDVGAGLEVAERLVLLAAPLVAAADADDAAVLDEQPVGRRLRQHERPAGLCELGEVAAHLGDRDDPVAVVAQGRRRRDPQRALAREHVHALAWNLAVGRQALELIGAALEPPPDGARVHHGTGEQV